MCRLECASCAVNVLNSKYFLLKLYNRDVRRKKKTRSFWELLIWRNSWYNGVYDDYCILFVKCLGVPTLRSFRQFFPRLRVLQMICIIRRAEIHDKENVSMRDRLMWYYRGTSLLLVSIVRDRESWKKSIALRLLPISIRLHFLQCDSIIIDTRCLVELRCKELMRIICERIITYKNEKYLFPFEILYVIIPLQFYNVHSIFYSYIGVEFHWEKFLVSKHVTPFFSSPFFFFYIILSLQCWIAVSALFTTLKQTITNLWWNLLKALDSR